MLLKICIFTILCEKYINKIEFCSQDQIELNLGINQLRKMAQAPSTGHGRYQRRSHSRPSSDKIDLHGLRSRATSSPDLSINRRAWSELNSHNATVRYFMITYVRHRVQFSLFV